MTALDIINQARERLGDIDKKRWSDNRLLRIVSTGQIDICKWTSLIRRVVYLPFSNGINTYTLPSDCFRVSRVEYQDELVPLHTRDDFNFPRSIVTSYIALKSNLNMNKIEIYPTPTGLETITGWVQGEVTDNFWLDNKYGVVIYTTSPNYVVDSGEDGLYLGEVTYDTVNPLTMEEHPSTKYGEMFGYTAQDLGSVIPNNYGVVVKATNGVEDSNKVYGFVSSVRTGHKVANLYGITTDVSELQNALKIYYVALPPRLKYKEAYLVIPDLWEDLLLKYVVGTALQDDNDANNIQRGEMELEKYRQQVAKLRNESAKDFSGGAKDKLVTNYRRI